MPKSKKTEEILKAAEKVYESARLEKVTVTDICEEADISRKTFYQRFKNLDELLESLLKHISETTITRISVNGNGETIWEQLWRMLDIYTVIGESHPVVRAIYSARFDRWVSWKQTTFTDKLDQIIQHELIRIIQDGAAIGAFRETDAEALAKTVTAIAGINFFYYSNSSFFHETKAEEIKTGLKLMLERTLKPS
jgi:AcrR family transcriptional regulator